MNEYSITAYSNSIDDLYFLYNSELSVEELRSYETFEELQANLELGILQKEEKSVAPSDIYFPEVKVLKYYKLGKIFSGIAITDNFTIIIQKTVSVFEVDRLITLALYELKKLDRFIVTDKNTITVTGDTYIGEFYGILRKNYGKFHPANTKDYTYSFENVRQFFTNSYNIVNNECVLTENFSDFDYATEGFKLGGDPEKTIAAYKKVGIDAVLTGNNHAYDFGADTLRQSTDTFRKNGLPTVGTGTMDEAYAPLVLAVGGKTVLIFNAYYVTRPHLYKGGYTLGEKVGVAPIKNIVDEYSFLGNIRKYREKYPNAFILLCPHWNGDYQSDTKHIKPLAALAVSCGVDLILGSGPHIIIGLEYISNVPCVYSLGNFVMNSASSGFAKNGKFPYGLVAKIDFSQRKQLKLYPVFVNNKRQKYQPCPVDEEQFNQLNEALLGVDYFTKDKDELGFYYSLDL